MKAGVGAALFLLATCGVPALAQSGTRPAEPDPILIETAAAAARKRLAPSDDASTDAEGGRSTAEAERETRDYATENALEAEEAERLLGGAGRRSTSGRVGTAVLVICAVAALFVAALATRLLRARRP
jgi:hypothetical protein